MFLVGCGSGSADTLPSAVISNIQYFEVLDSITFQVTFKDESQTAKNTYITLNQDGKEIDMIYFAEDVTTYEFGNIEADIRYELKVYSSYIINDIDLKNVEIHSTTFLHVIDGDGYTFSNKTYQYNGEKQSIYVENVSELYDVIYVGNGKTDVGEYTVIAIIYDDDGNVIDELTAIMIITKSLPTIVAENQTYEYTGNPISAVYYVSNESDVSIKYNGTTVVPSNVGVYTVVITTEGSTTEYTTSKTITMEITKVSIEIEVNNTFVLYDGKEKQVNVLLNIDCEYSVYYNGSLELPVESGTYTCQVVVENTNNYEGINAVVSLVIVDENEINHTEEIYISQLVLDDGLCVIQIFNGTIEDVLLSDYSLVIDDKTINFSGVTLESLDSYVVVNSSKYSNYYADSYSSYITFNDESIIKLVKDVVTIDVVELTGLQDYCSMIRCSDITSGKEVFDCNEWVFYNDKYISNLEDHKFSYINKNFEDYVNVVYSNNLTIDHGSLYDFNDYLTIYNYYNEIIEITPDMIYSNNIDIDENGTYDVVFEISSIGVNFTIQFTVADISGPSIVLLEDAQIHYEIGDQLPDILAMLDVTDNDSGVLKVEIDFTNVYMNESGMYTIYVTAIDLLGNVSYFSFDIIVGEIYIS